MDLRRLFFYLQSQGRFHHEPEPQLSSQEEQAYQIWWQERKRFHQAEVANSHWMKTCQAGYVTHLHLKADGQVVERHLFNGTEVKGQWQCLEEGLIRVVLNTQSHQYRFDIVGQGETNLHCALEYEDEELHTQLRIGQLQSPL